jgi:hypothetical protein
MQPLSDNATAAPDIRTDGLRTDSGIGRINQARRAMRTPPSAASAAGAAGIIGDMQISRREDWDPSRCRQSESPEKKTAQPGSAIEYTPSMRE